MNNKKNAQYIIHESTILTFIFAVVGDEHTFVVLVCRYRLTEIKTDKRRSWCGSKPLDTLTVSFEKKYILKRAADDLDTR